MFQSAVSRKSHPNLQIVWYEEMKADFRSILRQLSAHISVDLSESQLDTLVDHLSIDSMRKQALGAMGANATKEEKTKTETFYRKGQVGDWKNHFKVKRPNETELTSNPVGLLLHIFVGSR